MLPSSGWPQTPYIYTCELEIFVIPFHEEQRREKTEREKERKKRKEKKRKEKKQQSPGDQIRLGLGRLVNGVFI